MFFGSHVSIAGGIELAPARAATVGCEVLQIFSRSPRGGPAPKLSPANIKAYRANCKKFYLKESYLHAPYFINFASQNPRIAKGSVSVIKEELERGSALGVKYLMTHLGTAKDCGKENALAQTTRAIISVLINYHGSTRLLLEQSAGAGGDDGVIGGELTELAVILKAVNAQLDPANRAGICIDTCHAFAMGYDLRDKKSIEDFVRKIDQTIGLKNLLLWHFNDSKFGLGQRRDRHEHIGQGEIGVVGFQTIINHPKLKHLNAVLETPKDNDGKYDKINLNFLKKLRQQI